MSESDRMRLPVAGILVGGASRRMGRPKALLPHALNGSFLEHVVAIAKAAAEEVVLLGAPVWPIPQKIAALPILHDAMPGCGPMAGLATLLRYHPREKNSGRPDWAGWRLLLSCDLPQLSAEAIDALSAALRDGVDAAFFRSAISPVRAGPMASCSAFAVDPAHESAPNNPADAFDLDGCGPLLIHACCACYHVRALPVVERLLSLGRLRMQELRFALDAAELVPDDVIRHQLLNVNEPIS